MNAPSKLSRLRKYRRVLRGVRAPNDASSSAWPSIHDPLLENLPQNSRTSGWYTLFSADSANGLTITTVAPLISTCN